MGDDSQERKPFTDGEVADLLAAAPDHEWHGLILVAAFTGLRMGDAAGLSWGAVDLETKRITLIPAKTKRKKREVCIEEGQDKGAGRITFERGFRSLRHTFTSWLRNAGVSEEDRMVLTGHSALPAVQSSSSSR